MTKPTLKSVAEIAGVSPATASRALSGGQPIAPATREKVRTAAQKLGYEVRQAPKLTADSIVVMSPSLGHLALGQVLGGVEPVASAAGLSTIFQHSSHDPEFEIEAFRKLAKGKSVRAVVVVGAINATPQWRDAMEGAVETLANRGVRVVFCGRGLPNHGIKHVATIDYASRAGAADAVRVLLSKGHEKIACLRGPVGLSSSDERTKGYEDALRSFGFEVDPELVVPGPRSSLDAVDRVTALLRDRPDVTAIFADSDTQALGALHAAYKLGVRVPEDLSVIGFDDHRSTEVSIPALTTVHVPFEEIGQRAARAALGDDRELVPDRELTLATYVVMRDSVGVRRPAKH